VGPCLGSAEVDAPMECGFWLKIAALVH